MGFLIALAALIFLMLALCAVAHAQDIKLDAPKAELQHNVKAEQATYKGKPALRVTDAATGAGEFDDRLVILPDTNFQDGEITLELAGSLVPNAPEGARGLHVAVSTDPLQPDTGSLSRSDERGAERGHALQHQPISL